MGHGRISQEILTGKPEHMGTLPNAGQKIPSGFLGQFQARIRGGRIISAFNFKI